MSSATNTPARIQPTSQADALPAMGQDDLHRTLIAAVPEGLLVLDEDGVVLDSNPAADALFGHPAGALAGRRVDALLQDPKAGLAGFLGRDPRAVHPVEGINEAACLRADGTRITVELSVGEVAGPDGRRLFAAVVRDASAKRGLEDALLDTEQRLGGITANVPGIVFQRVRLSDGTILYPFFSGAVGEVLGYDPDDMRQTPDGCLDVVHWADRDALMDAIHHSARTLEPCVEEFRAITRSGEVKWLRGTSRPQPMGEGQVLWDGVLIDVTDRKRAEQRLEMIMEHAADSIVTVNEEGRIESVNAAAEKLFGYEAEEVLGRNVGILMPPGEREEHDVYITRYLLSGEGRMIGSGPRELVACDREGNQFPIELSLSEVRSEGRLLFIAVIRDITKRKRTEKALKETEQRLRSVASNLPGMVFQRMLGADGSLHYLYASEGCRDVLGVEPDDLCRDSSLFLDVLAHRDRESFLASLRQSARTLEPVEEEFKIQHRDGRECWLRGLSRPRRLDTGETVWDGILLDVTDRKRAEDRLEFLAYHDPLTGVGNRSLFLERFSRARLFAERLQHRIGILSLGMDRFSIINASMGHEVGDKILQAVAQRLRNTVGPSDTVARAGGDRFIILLNALESDQDLTDTVDALLTAFDEPLKVNDQDFSLSVSIGACLYPDDGESAEILIKNADTALHRAKTQGPSSVQRFTPDMNARAIHTLSVQKRLRRALENEEFIAFFQPQADGETGEITGMEALVRWQDPERGLVPPGEFIPVAEEYGLIDAICEHVLRYSCIRNQEWVDQGLARVPVAVNISGRQFHNTKKLLGLVQSVLDETGLDPGLLELELTESTAMADPDNAIEVVRTLRARDIACAIDDFGTGYSSLNVLKRFPIHKLKIDRSFVSDVIIDANDATICAAIVAMARALGLKVVAEGVEERDQLRFLRDLKCDQIQGYLFIRPLSAQDMTALFKAKTRLAFD